MRRKIGLLIAAAMLFVAVAGGWSMLLSYREAQSTTGQASPAGIIRFHVIAHSDSDYDQSVKLKVRDKVLAYLAPQLEKAGSPEDARQIILSQRSKLIAIADEVLADNGAGYRADLTHSVYEFPLKTYGDLVIPAGRYEAVRITLGEAQGKNWWCVLFPPLCFIDINTTVAAQPVSLAQSADIKQFPEKKVEYKWKLAEWLNKQ